VEATSVPAPSTTAKGGLVEAMRRYPLVFFFLMAFGITWASDYVILVVLHLRLDPTDFRLLAPQALLGIGPMLAAFLMTAITEGRRGIRHLLLRFALWRVGVTWYVIVLLAVPVLVLITLLIMPGALSTFRLPGLSFWPAYLMGYVGVLVFGGPLGEEPGWRGFALPRLQQRLGPLRGTLLLGALWALWHLPLYLLPEGYGTINQGLGYSLTAFLAFTVLGIALSVLFTWMFNNTQGSLLLAILLHTSINAPLGYLSSLLFPSSQLDAFQVRITMVLVFGAVAMLLIIVTRGRLSYERVRMKTSNDLDTSERGFA
jgi:membrane protease YdiL (CAAX protease family)